MKIALLHYTASPVVGGVESVVSRHAALMRDAGHEVRIFAGRGDPADPCMTLIPEMDSRNAAVLKIKNDLDRGVIPDDFQRLSQAIREKLSSLFDFDRVIAHNICSLHKNLPLTQALVDLNRSDRFPRLILWQHDLAWTAPRYARELHPGLPWDLLRTRWDRALYVTVSEFRRQELADLLGLPPDEIHVVPNGIDADSFLKLDERSQELLSKVDLLRSFPILLLPVRLTPRKNIEMALRTLACLRPSMPEAVLVVTGPLGAHNPQNEGYFTRLKDLRHTLGLEGAALFLAEIQEEYLPDSVIADFFRIADALFIPSLEEGFGIPLLEAALSRLPVFCSDIPPFREIGGPLVHYFPLEASPEEVAEQIHTGLVNSDAAQFAKQVRQGCTWQDIYHKFLAPLLEKV